jgi:hypothetical protein
MVRYMGQMAAKLLEAVRKLPPGEVRQDIFKQIGKFRVRIDALREKTELSVCVNGRIRT